MRRLIWAMAPALGSVAWRHRATIRGWWRDRRTTTGTASVEPVAATTA